MVYIYEDCNIVKVDEGCHYCCCELRVMHSIMSSILDLCCITHSVNEMETFSTYVFMLFMLYLGELYVIVIDVNIVSYVSLIDTLHITHIATIICVLGETTFLLEYVDALDYIKPMLDTLWGPQVCYKSNTPNLMEHCSSGSLPPSVPLL